MNEEPLLGAIRKIPTQRSAKLQSAHDPFYNKISDITNPLLRNTVEKVLTNKDGTVGTKQILDHHTEMTLYAALEVAEPVYNLANLAELYDTNPFHASAIDAKTDSVVGLGHNFKYSSKVIKQLEKIAKKEGGPDRKRVLELKLDDKRDKFIELLYSMNAEMEFQEILQRIYLDRLIMGNAYLEIGRSPNGTISYIGHVSPINIRIRRKRDGYVQMVKGKTVFFRNFGDKKTKDPINKDPNPNELIHIRRYSPKDEYYGLPESTSTITAMAGMKFAEQYNIDFFENKAVPRYIIKSKGLLLGENEQNELLKFFETNLKGSPHRTIYIPVPAGNDKDIDFVPVETGKQDGHFLQYIRDSTQFILSRHRVPQARIGLSSAATSQAESREAEKTFKETVCQPEQRMIETKLNKVIRELTDMFEFELKEYALTDEDTRSQIDERYLRWGVTLPDEIRTRMNLGPRPDGRGAEAQDMLSIAVKQSELNAEAAEQLAKHEMAMAKEQAKVQARIAEQQAKTQAANAAAKPAPGAKPAAGAKPTAKPAQAKAEQRSQQYQSRTRDQNRNADNPRKNENNRNGQRPAGSGKAPNKR